MYMACHDCTCRVRAKCMRCLEGKSGQTVSGADIACTPAHSAWVVVVLCLVYSPIS